MTGNPFLDRGREIVQGRSEEDILARWDDILRQRAEEAEEDAAMRARLSEEGNSVYSRLSCTSMAGGGLYMGPSAGSWESVAKGIEYAAKHGASVASMSLSDSQAKVPFPSALEEAIKYAQSKGTIVVVGSKSEDCAKTPEATP